jgi:hypothetical protein
MCGQEYSSLADRQGADMAYLLALLDEIAGTALGTTSLSCGSLQMEDDSAFSIFSPQIPVMLQPETVVQYARGHRVPPLPTWSLGLEGILLGVPFICPSGTHSPDEPN